ncbi:GNAT family N-acetyltransferase [Shewanella sp. SNU WT4]|uniref:GNAT family N-acetyltransferase n=1 Tax=Shewanella sp. SNU WT4 TaxID=2590015 RepID=UPI001F0F7259|nr:GNAT family N-acetyltransferase [Shewanella sp. SNU WT4]
MSVALMTPDFYIIAYHKDYALAVSELFHQAVQGIEHPSYSLAQINAWSSAPRSARHWHQRLSRSQSWLAVLKEQGTCIGFINVESGFRELGYIDSLYIDPAYQGLGVGSQLIAKVITWGQDARLSQLTLDASYLSRPLFSKHGFVQQQKIYQIKSGQIIPSFQMSLEL